MDGQAGGSSWVIGNVSPLLGYLVTAESADDAALSVMPWLRVAKGQRYTVSAGNVKMMGLAAGEFCLKVAIASNHAWRSRLGRKVSRGYPLYFELLYFRLPKLCYVRYSTARLPLGPLATAISNHDYTYCAKVASQHSPWEASQVC